MLTVKELSAWLNIKPSTLYLWVSQGKDPCCRIHGRIRFEPEAIQRWLNTFSAPRINLPRFTRHDARDVGPFTLLEQKNGAKDTLPVNAKTLEVLKARARVRSLKSDYVFFNGAGNLMDARDLLRVFYPVMRKAEVKHFRFHDLRHTFATRVVQAGGDIYTVQKLGRWKTISMVMRYAHHHPESLRAGVEVLERIPAEVSTVLAQRASHARVDVRIETAVSG